jgi:hypothetical protein
MKSDISRGDGYVLADGPQRRIPDNGDAISDAFAEAAAFLLAHRDLLATELSSEEPAR